MSVWNDVKHIVEAAAAKAQDGRPCATMNGKGGAGSCVKMYLLLAKWFRFLPETIAVRTCQEAGPQKKTIIFQPSIFRCCVSFREGRGFRSFPGGDGMWIFLGGSLGG